MSESLYPKVPPDLKVINGSWVSREDSFAGEGPDAGALHQVKLLERRVSELTRQLEVEKKAGDFREESFRKALDERDTAREEATELRKRWNLSALSVDPEADARFSQWEASLKTDDVKRAVGRGDGWLAPHDAESLRRDVVRIREERDELRRQVDVLHTPEEMAEAVEAARNAGIESAAEVVDFRARESHANGKSFRIIGRSIDADQHQGFGVELHSVAAQVRALKRSTSEKAP